MCLHAASLYEFGKVCANVAFLCVVKNEHETDSLGLSGQNQDDKIHR